MKLNVCMRSTYSSIAWVRSRRKQMGRKWCNFTNFHHSKIYHKKWNVVETSINFFRQSSLAGERRRVENFQFFLISKETLNSRRKYSGFVSIEFFDKKRWGRLRGSVFVEFLRSKNLSNGEKNHRKQLDRFSSTFKCQERRAEGRIDFFLNRKDT